MKHLLTIFIVLLLWSTVGSKVYSQTCWDRQASFYFNYFVDTKTGNRLYYYNGTPLVVLPGDVIQPHMYLYAYTYYRNNGNQFPPKDSKWHFEISKDDGVTWKVLKTWEYDDLNNRTNPP